MLYIYQIYYRNYR